MQVVEIRIRILCTDRTANPWTSTKYRRPGKTVPSLSSVAAVPGGRYSSKASGSTRTRTGPRTEDRVRGSAPAPVPELKRCSPPARYIDAGPGNRRNRSSSTWIEKAALAPRSCIPSRTESYCRDRRRSWHTEPGRPAVRTQAADCSNTTDGVPRSRLVRFAATPLGHDKRMFWFSWMSVLLWSSSMASAPCRTVLSEN